MSTPNHDEIRPGGPEPPPSVLQVYRGIVRHWTEYPLGTSGIPDMRTMHRQTHRFPTEILEMVVACLISDIPSLKACATTCFAWYNAAAPHLHHTLILRQRHPDPAHQGLKPLSELAELGLLPLVRGVQFRSYVFNDNGPWVAPRFFSTQSRDYWLTLAGIQYLTVEDLDFSMFETGVEKYSVHLSPTLQSLTLIHPRCHPRQLLDFLRLFPKLDDIRLINCEFSDEEDPTPNTLHAPILGSFRGNLTIRSLLVDGVLRDFIAASGGARFIEMNLYDVLEMQLLLETCAETLETLRIYPNGLLQFCDPLTDRFHLSYNTVLRTLEVRGSHLFQKCGRTLKKLLSTITSPVFNEVVIVFAGEDVYCPPLGIAGVLREMYEIKRFHLAYRLEDLESSRESNLRELVVVTQKEVASGSFDFLPCPPLVVSRAVTRDEVYIM